MLKNYLKIAFRNFVRQKAYSALNIIGLMLGLTASFLIGLYIMDELSYDKFHYEAQNIYRVALHGKIAGQEIKTNSSCPPLSEALINEVPGVEQSTRLMSRSGIVMKHKELAFTEYEVFVCRFEYF
ncbi:MAG: ABC transporter permease [Flammeovirgaceae bacterium]|nr:ABC transporter permease [Flammeovirgaceae bacterium]